MLKSRVRPLVTLVLALVATGVLSTLASANAHRTDGDPGISAGAGSKPRPVAYEGGEPDQPLNTPPPPLRGNGSSLTPPVTEGDSGSFMSMIRWISLLWDSWFAEATD